MPDYSSLYRAKLVQATPTALTVFVPQVFGDVPIDVTEWIGTPVQGMGWVFFQAGNAEHPVWMSPQGGASGGGGDGGAGQDEVFIGPSNPGTGFELWYDTDDPGQPTDLVWVGPSAPTNPTTEIWWDTDEPTTAEQFVNVSGDTMTGELNMGGFRVWGLPDTAISASSALSRQAGDDRYATKQYVDGTEVAPTYSASWAPLGGGFAAPRLVRVGNVVTLTFAVAYGGANVAIGTGAVFMTLPSNYRPRDIVSLPAMVHTTESSPTGYGSAHRVDIASTGVATLRSNVAAENLRSGNFVLLSGSFLV